MKRNQNKLRTVFRKSSNLRFVVLVFASWYSICQLSGFAQIRNCQGEYVANLARENSAFNDEVTSIRRDGRINNMDVHSELSDARRRHDQALAEISRDYQSCLMEAHREEEERLKAEQEERDRERKAQEEKLREERLVEQERQRQEERERQAKFEQEQKDQQAKSEQRQKLGKQQAQSSKENQNSWKSDFANKVDQGAAAAALEAAKVHLKDKYGIETRIPGEEGVNAVKEYIDTARDHAGLLDPLTTPVATGIRQIGNTAASLINNSAAATPSSQQSSAGYSSAPPFVGNPAYLSYLLPAPEVQLFPSSIQPDWAGDPGSSNIQPTLSPVQLPQPLYELIPRNSYQEINDESSQSFPDSPRTNGVLGIPRDSYR